MVKKKNSKKKMARPRAARPRVALDMAAMEYARLLVDPCGSKIVHPVYPGGNAGFLFRSEIFNTVGTGATDTAGFLHWTPGYVNFTDTEVLTGTGSSPTLALTATASGGTLTPGKTFLTNNVKGVRCVAACLKVTFPGTESARSGRVHYGLTNAGMIDNGNTISVNSVASTLQHYSRTPADTIELVWKPNQADFEFNDPSEVASPLLRDRKASITVAWAGLPAAVGMTFHLTAVYEWTPVTGLGVATDALGKNMSRNTFDDVLDSVIASGFTFVRSAGTAAGSALGAGLTAALSSTFGLMPTVGRSRARQTYLT